MQIKSLTIENFRTFYKKTKIEFSTDQRKNVTFFIGKNGAGKTTLMNAVYWVFTGNFTERLEEKESILNKYAKEKNDQCSVEVEFLNDDKRYVLRRVLGKSTVENSISLSEDNGKGSLVPISDSIAKELIEKLIPNKLAKWFFFDGEDVGALKLHGDIKFKEQLQQTFGFSQLEVLKKTLEDIDNDFRKEETKLINNNELTDIQKQIEELEDDQIQKIKRIDKLKNTKELCDGKIRDSEKRLRSYPESEVIQKRRDSAFSKLEEAKNLKNQKEQERNEYFVKNISNKLIFSNLENLIKKIDTKEEEQTLPEPFGDKLITQIKYQKKCICGTVVLPGSPEEFELDKTAARGATSLLLQKISCFRSEIGGFYKEALNYENRINLFTEELSKIVANIADYESAINRADKEMADVPENEINKIELALNESKDQLARALTELGAVQNNYELDQSKLIKLKARQDVILSQQQRTSHVRRERDKAKRLYNYLCSEFSRQENEVLEALNAEITNVFSKYLTKNFTAKVEPGTYAVSTYDFNGNKAPLSPGENNLLKFAFITAIVGMASSRSENTRVNWITDPIVVPIMLDAPFSILAPDYRNAVTKKLAELSSQLIMLFDDGKWNESIQGEENVPEILAPITGKAYVMVSSAEGSDKGIYSRIKIGSKIINLNTYGERDETIITEVTL
jgi:DNA sulfur modification protein DndD